MARIHPQVHPSIESETWGPIQSALTLLPESMQDTMPNIELAHREFSPAQRQYTNAFVDKSTSNPSINLVDSGPLWRAARGGGDNDLKHLASVLAHERGHAVDGMKEEPAYALQLEVLKRLNAPKGMMKSVSDARDTAIRQQ